MFSLLSTLTLLIACGEKEPTADTGSILEDTGSEVEDTGAEDTDTQDTEDTNDTQDTQDTDTQDTSDTDDTQDTDTQDTDTQDNQSDVTDYGALGPYTYSTSTGTDNGGSCSLPYSLMTPDGVTDPQLVVLGHGFMRSADNMVGWAQHFASWGFEVAVPSLCHSSIFDVNHAENGLDMVALATALGGNAIFSGYSAGGLSAVVAAASSSDAVGLLGLDATDGGFNDNSLYASGLTIPVMGIAGEPSLCNSENNGVDLYQNAASSLMVRVTEADHCDFEAPTDMGCEALCQGTNNQFSNEEINNSILSLSTAALFWISTQDPAAAEWWTSGGEAYDSLLSSGRIQGL